MQSESEVREKHSFTISPPPLSLTPLVIPFDFHSFRLGRERGVDSKYKTRPFGGRISFIARSDPIFEKYAV